MVHWDWVTGEPAPGVPPEEVAKVKVTLEGTATPCGGPAVRLALGGVVSTYTADSLQLGKLSVCC